MHAHGTHALTHAHSTHASMHAHSTHALTHTHALIQQMVEQATSWTDCPVSTSLWLHAFYVVSLILWGAEERSGKLPHRLKLSSSFMKKKSKLLSSLTKLMGKCASTWLYRSAFMTSLLYITVVTSGCGALRSGLSISQVLCFCSSVFSPSQDCCRGFWDVAAFPCPPGVHTTVWCC